MKKLDLGQTINTLANLGVIAGIVFLAIELQQNNNLLESQARLNLDANRVAMQNNLIQNTGGIADLVYRARIGEPLTGAEEWRLDVRRSQLLRNYESMYKEVERGPLLESDIPIKELAISFTTDPRLGVMWSERRNDFDPDFVRFMDEHIINER